MASLPAHPSFSHPGGPQHAEPPKVLTAMGKMVQQIATINNLLIFINIQISQHQRQNGGAASGEGPLWGGGCSPPPPKASSVGVGGSLLHLGSAPEALGAATSFPGSALQSGGGVWEASRGAWHPPTPVSPE